MTMLRYVELIADPLASYTRFHQSWITAPITYDYSTAATLLPTRA